MMSFNQQYHPTVPETNPLPPPSNNIQQWSSCPVLPGFPPGGGNNQLNSFTTAATVVSNITNNTSTHPPDYITAPHQQPHPPTLTELPTHPIPEFLCQILSMVQDPSLSHIISWVVPSTHDEEDGDIPGVGKIVIYDPKQLESQVLGKYYRHSKFSSFQRQMNYFGFKKRIRGGKKGKMCACSFVNENLGGEAVSLLGLKRKMKRQHLLEAEKKRSHDEVSGTDNNDDSQYMNLRGERFFSISEAAADARLVNAKSDDSLHGQSSGAISGQVLGGNGPLPVNNSFGQVQNELNRIPSNGSGTSVQIEQEQNTMQNNINAFGNLASCNYQTASNLQIPASFTNQAFQISTVSSPPFQPQPNISFTNNYPLQQENTCINNNMITNQATLAAQAAKQSLFQAFQKSQLDLLQKERDKAPQQPVPNTTLYPPHQGTFQGNTYPAPISVITLPTNQALPPIMVQNPIVPVVKRDISNQQQPIPLPNSIDELFDEGSKCSLLCDEEELKDADDCSLLSVELGLAG